MDYKEKYEEALENIKAIKAANKDNKGLVDFIEFKYPKLKESDDEKIRKNLIRFFRDLDALEYKEEDVIAWLEKQGEKPNVWSEEDDDNMRMIEDRLSNYLDYIREDSTLTKHQKNSLKEKVIGYVNWLKSLKERLKGE